MATLILPLPLSAAPARASFNALPQRRTPPAVLFTGNRRTRRGMTMVTRAGPSTNSYIFAFVVPATLLAVTIFTSMRIAEKLDEQYLQELAMDEAIMEAEEDADEEGGDGDAGVSVEEEVKQPAFPGTRTRNRPIREA